MLSAGLSLFRAVDALLYSAEGTHQGDPLSMLYFELVLHLLILRIATEYYLDVNGRGADEGTLGGRIEEANNAFDIISEAGPVIHYSMYDVKSNAWLPSMSHTNLTPLNCNLLMDDVDRPAPGIDLLGSSVGTDAFVLDFLREKVDIMETVLAKVDEMHLRNYPTSLYGSAHSYVGWHMHCVPRRQRRHCLLPRNPLHGSCFYSRRRTDPFRTPRGLSKRFPFESAAEACRITLLYIVLLACVSSRHCSHKSEYSRTAGRACPRQICSPCLSRTP